MLKISHFTNNAEPDYFLINYLKGSVTTVEAFPSRAAI